MLRDLVSYDNEMGVKSSVPDLAIIPEVLHAMGMAPDMERARFELALLSGEHFALDVSPVRALTAYVGRCRGRRCVTGASVLEEPGRCILV